MPNMKDGYFDLNSFDGPKVAPKQPAKKPEGGLSGFLGSVVKGVANPFIETGRAIRYVPEAVNREIHNKPIDDIQKKAFGTTNQGDIAQKIVGNTAQVGLTIAAPGASTVKKGAAIGAGTGASAALAQPESTVGDVATGALTGGITGGVLSKAGNILSKTGKAKKGGFMENLTTQGQQMQGRGLGISGGAKVAGKELSPQDTERMLQTLQKEGIKTGNANGAARDLGNRLKGYGQQIADHFKTSSAPLKPEDTKVISNNFVDSLKTTDPRILEEANILVNDLQKNVKSTKDLWEFRKSLDNRIPDAKQATDASLSNKIAATKSMRQYISKELGDIPGMQGYHDLAEIKPFLGKGMRELNQSNSHSNGGIWQHILNSGPVHKAEAIVGKGLEKIGSAGTKEAPVASTPQSDLSSGVAGFLGKLTRQGATTAAANAATTEPDTAGSLDVPQDDLATTTPDSLSGSADELGFGGGSTSNTDPFAPENVQTSVKSILAQGGDMKDVAAYLSNVESLQKLREVSGGGSKALNSTASGVIADTKTGLQALQDLSGKIMSSNANNPLIGQIRSKNPFDTNAQNLQASVATAKQIVGKALEGGVLRKEDEAKYAKLLPTMGDTDKVAQYKIQQLTSLISNRLGEYQSNISGGTGGTDLATLGL